MRKRKNNIVPIFIGLIILLGIGYAYLNSGLSINGTANISNASWNVYWDSVNVTEGSVEDVTTAAHILTGETEVEFNVNFTKPGDFYEFTVGAVNGGTIDAMIDNLTKGVYAANGTTPKTLPDYLEYTVSYSSGAPIQKYQYLKQNTIEIYKVRVHYKEDIESSQLPSTADNYVFKFGVTYVQATDSAKDIIHPETFADDSWEKIISIVQAGYGDVYPVGSTKTIDMGTFGTHTLRIANTSTPAECSTTGFSQTACGFVLEFADIIIDQRMNPYDSSSTATGNGNIGGWPASEMRTYVNSDIYNALPSELKNAIIDTTVVSGHGFRDGTNFTSTDKLYLLSTHEVWEDDDGNSNMGVDRYDTAYNNTRQLDYYSNLGVTTSNSSGTIKKNGTVNSTWWLRLADSSSYSNFLNVVSNGNWNYNSATSTLGVSPAFRLG